MLATHANLARATTIPNEASQELVATFFEAHVRRILVVARIIFKSENASTWEIQGKLLSEPVIPTTSLL
jgi:hypothetical protein